MGIWRGMVMFLLFLGQQVCATKEQEHATDCLASFCGKIANISRPFRLKGDPIHCGDRRYELNCENNVTVLNLYGKKYHVQAINYDNFTIRVVDPGVEEPSCSSLPRYLLSQSNFTDTYLVRSVDPYRATQFQFSEVIGFYEKSLFKHIIYLNCSHPVSENHRYVNTTPCVKWESKGYMYAFAGNLTAASLEVGCRIKLVSPTSWWGLDENEYSYTVMNTALRYGFEMSWLHSACDAHCGNSSYGECYMDSSILKLQCSLSCDILSLLLTDCGKATWLQRIANGAYYFVIYVGAGLVQTIKGNLRFQVYIWNFESVSRMIGGYGVPLFLLVRILFGLTLLIVLMIYKWRKRHLSMYENIENYLEHNNLMPIRYSYKEIKKMVKAFKEKLGEGGYGSVFKGKLSSGTCVAIKMMNKSKGNGHDFISEVATIGRIHHQNVVQLIGFCVEGSRRALVYEFMSNGSLDRIIFSKDRSIDFDYNKIYHISIGIARGIAYLHHGCEMQILHFDIKPHNILLDDNFIPKVSDFGLARLFPVDNSIDTMTAVGGTIGYMAPELFYKNIGRISHKSDVYSFGMLLMEMASRRKNLNSHAEHSSQIFFPSWVYENIREEKDIEMEDITEEEKKIAKKMIIVALWCIQLNPNDRPSMNKVVEMLEEEMENLEIPPNFSLYPYEASEYSKQTIGSEFISSSSCSTKISINPTIKNSS
ncbi:LEAF RUST 10 DISEASE-RESISTANCE LOCUS RECEPTOR-LIKE PROTEIN KINASE-like 2.2 [Vigna radiata var. radiata]|uniref:LEAF RUST 10 DISEASE-RESISTANCE LOCUS RECEPTOR-LIKE PROTEIN KINASE-like 2.2 n=1 Tax=Vigna radiata var. radiata TaxID=3916 RepID=A0A1S3VUE4_VIGRR|nr:LEAF RUST 10 DISEASE-RESISTANCE LOCUS RECEPTOR-LIKE PROTEIN KINASE-like 2.2 [Vigna radiata var. radiata]